MIKLCLLIAMELGVAGFMLAMAVLNKDTNILLRASEFGFSGILVAFAAIGTVDYAVTKFKEE